MSIEVDHIIMIATETEKNDDIDINKDHDRDQMSMIDMDIERVDEYAIDQEQIINIQIEDMMFMMVGTCYVQTDQNAAHQTKQ